MRDHCLSELKVDGLVLKETELHYQYIDGLVQERHNSSALAMELRLSCTNPSIFELHFFGMGMMLNLISLGLIF